jgi:DNA-binding FadR family transcriptional regulator
MVEIYGAGRASVREALRILEVQGVVTIRPGKGGGPVLERFKTRSVSTTLKLYLQQHDATYANVLEARAAMDPQIGWQAAVKAQPADHVVIRDLFLDHEIAVPTGDYDRVGVTSQRLLAAVGAASHNPALSVISSALRDIYSWRVHEYFVEQKYWKRNLLQLRQLVSSIETGDAEGARTVLVAELAAEAAFATRRFSNVLRERVRWD